MNQLQSTIERGLQAQQVLDQPKTSIPATVFSVYAPRDLVIAFKQVCKAQRRPHGSIMRRLMADYIDDALQDGSSLFSREPESRRLNDSEGKERHAGAIEA